MPFNPPPSFENQDNSTLRDLKRNIIDQQRTRTFFENLTNIESFERFRTNIRPTQTTYYNALLGRNVTRKSNGTTNYD